MVLSSGICWFNAQLVKDRVTLFGSGLRDRVSFSCCHFLNIASCFTGGVSFTGSGFSVFLWLGIQGQGEFLMALA